MLNVNIKYNRITSEVILTTENLNLHVGVLCVTTSMLYHVCDVCDLYLGTIKLKTEIHM